jgi:hypothetical protein
MWCFSNATKKAFPAGRFSPSARCGRRKDGPDDRLKLAAEIGIDAARCESMVCRLPRLRQYSVSAFY